jgi:hypothetical protein
MFFAQFVGAFVIANYASPGSSCSSLYFDILLQGVVIYQNLGLTGTIPLLLNGIWVNLISVLTA